jgi:biotin operon repressor
MLSHDKGVIMAEYITTSRAAAMLGVTRATVVRRAHRLGIEGRRVHPRGMVWDIDDIRRIARAGGNDTGGNLGNGSGGAVDDRDRALRLWSQAEVARMLGVSRQRVNQVVRRRRLGIEAADGRGRWLTEADVAELRR